MSPKWLIGIVLVFMFFAWVQTYGWAHLMFGW